MRYSITHKDANDAGRTYMQSNNLVIFVVMSAIIGGAWMERDTLKKYWDSYVNPPSQASQTTVYTWKDSEGTVHYSSHADDKHAKETIVDTRKISRLEPLPPSPSRVEPGRGTITCSSVVQFPLKEYESVLPLSTSSRITPLSSPLSRWAPGTDWPTG